MPCNMRSADLRTYWISGLLVAVSERISVPALRHELFHGMHTPHNQKKCLCTPWYILQPSFTLCQFLENILCSRLLTEHNPAVILERVLSEHSKNAEVTDWIYSWSTLMTVCLLHRALFCPYFTVYVSNCRELGWQPIPTSSSSMAAISEAKPYGGMYWDGKLVNISWHVSQDSQ